MGKHTPGPWAMIEREEGWQITEAPTIEGRTWKHSLSDGRSICPVFGKSEEDKLFRKLYESFLHILEQRVWNAQDAEEITQDILVTVSARYKEINFEKRHVKEVILHPIHINKDNSQGGIPFIAEGENAHEILERLSRLSEEYNTKILIEDNKVICSSLKPV